jgi:cellulose synthase/poly-beta-1,6-N-acetylglucosamine synthase-like glycosyltransferase
LLVASLTSAPEISILICSRDRRTDLLTLVADLKRLVPKSPSIEIVVVEETDSPAGIEGVFYVDHPVRNRGVAYARNLALRNSAGKIVVFLDDDCRIDAAWLGTLLEPLGNDNVLAVQGGVTVPDSANALGWAETILGFPGGGIKRILQSGNRVLPTREISTLNCAYRRTAVEQAGGFDERLSTGGEDYLLAKQICTNHHCLYVPSAMVRHRPRNRLSAIWRWFVRRGRAEIAVVRTGKQTDSTYLSLLRASISVKLMIVVVPTLALGTDMLTVSALCGLLYVGLQYVRYLSIWRRSGAPALSLLALPLVKLTMDVAQDWGRLRGTLDG